MTIHALTVRQPWGSAMFRPTTLGPKNVENRTWSTPLRGPLAIHAGLNIDPAGVEFMHGITEQQERDRGHVLGIVQLVDCHETGVLCLDHGCDSNAWAQFVPGMRVFHWMLEHPREFVTPIKARGALGLWKPGPSVEHLISIAEVVL